MDRRNGVIKVDNVWSKPKRLASLEVYGYCKYVSICVSIIIETCFTKFWISLFYFVSAFVLCVDAYTKIIPFSKGTNNSIQSKSAFEL